MSLMQVCVFIVIGYLLLTLWAQKLNRMFSTNGRSPSVDAWVEIAVFRFWYGTSTVMVVTLLAVAAIFATTTR